MWPCSLCPQLCHWAALLRPLCSSLWFPTLLDSLLQDRPGTGKTPRRRLRTYRNISHPSSSAPPDIFLSGWLVTRGRHFWPKVAGSQSLCETAAGPQGEGRVSACGALAGLPSWPEGWRGPGVTRTSDLRPPRLPSSMLTACAPARAPWSWLPGLADSAPPAQLSSRGRPSFRAASLG